MAVDNMDFTTLGSSNQNSLRKNNFDQERELLVDVVDMRMEWKRYVMYVYETEEGIKFSCLFNIEL